MILPAKDPQGNDWNEAALMALVPAVTITTTADGLSITPDVDLDDYTALASQFFKSDLASYAAQVRYAKMTGGVTYQGHAIATDGDSRNNMSGAALGATIVGPSFATAWKCSDCSFLPLNHDQMLAMAVGVLAFVNGCYAVEAGLAAGIVAGTVTAKAAVDGAAWPSSVLAIAPAASP